MNLKLIFLNGFQALKQVLWASVLLGQSQGCLGEGRSVVGVSTWQALEACDDDKLVAEISQHSIRPFELKISFKLNSN